MTWWKHIERKNVVRISACYITVCVYIYVCVCVCVCACIFVCMSIHTHTHMHKLKGFTWQSPPLSLKEICRMWWANCSLVFFQVFGDYYHFRHRRVVKRSLSEHRGTHIRLHTEPQVCVKCRVWIRLRTALSRHVFPNKLKGHVDKSLTRWSKKPKYWSHWDLNRSKRKNRN